LFGVGGSAEELDMKALEKQIGEGLVAQLEVSVQSVECPVKRLIKVGDAFDCSARVEDVGRLMVTVTQQDNDGSINWKVTRTDGLLDLATLEAEIRTGLEAKSEGAEVKVSCGGRYRGIRVGAFFDCRAEDSDGEKIRVRVTMKDSAGNVKWKVVEDVSAP
jgi:hypothetical protein